MCFPSFNTIYKILHCVVSQTNMPMIVHIYGIFVMAYMEDVYAYLPYIKVTRTVHIVHEIHHVIGIY